MILTKRLLNIFISLLISTSFLFAQTITENRAVLNGETGSVAELNLNWSVKNLTGNSLLIRFPSQIISVPLQINLNRKSLWLKKSGQTPQKMDVVHWEINNSDLILHFAQGILQNGSQLSFRVQQNVQSSPKKITGSEMLQIFTVKKDNGDRFISGELLGQLQIPVQSGMNNK